MILALFYSLINTAQCSVSRVRTLKFQFCSMTSSRDGLTLASGIPGPESPIWIIVMQLVPVMFG